jgi:ribonuclease HII
MSSMISLDIERSLWLQGLEAVAGVDEAGRGPLAGPVVAAAVIFQSETWIAGVDDSKKLTEKKRNELFHRIKSSALSVGVGIIPHDTIDHVNIYQATMIAMHEAVRRLQREPDFILTDGRGFTHETIPHRNIVNGDALSFTIAAASIIAKVTRDEMMRAYDAQFPQYGFARHKGYGTKQHLAAIREHGYCEIHRRSFHAHAGRE